MEHRMSHRIKDALDVEIWHRGSFVGRHPTRDYCYEGLFLEIIPEGLSRSDLLDLVLYVRGKGLSMRGLVVHHHSDGVGVVLMDHVPDYREMVAESLEDEGLDSHLKVGSASGIEVIDITPEDASAPESKALWVPIGERLDISVSGKVVRVRRMIEGVAVDRLVIDLAETRHVYDSGLALLLLLHQHAGELKDHIHLINCGPRVRKRLTGSPIGSRFHIS